MPDERAGVGVAFYAVAFHQNYAVLNWFAETVPAIGRDRHDPPFERQVVRARHHAARAKARRF